MKQFWTKKWFFRLVSLLLAILIVIYIDSTQTGFVTQGEPSKTRETATETQTIRIPLQVSVDTDQYYVVGYPEKVKVTLSGSNALVTSAINTQNFRAYIDLTKEKIGKHRVRVRLSGLSKQLSYTVSPRTVTVNIQHRKSRTMPVQIEYNKNVVARGYHLGKAKVDPTEVEVTGPQSEINQIDQIVAKTSLPNGLNRNYERQVILMAEDKKKRQLNVVIQPSTATVTIPVSISKKKVKLSLSSKNENSNKVYSVTASQNDVTIYGDENALKKISKLNLSVDLRGIDVSTSKRYHLKLPKGVVRANPSDIDVQIRVKKTSNTKEN